MRLEWCETNIWLYLSEDLLLAAVTEWAWHESYVQVYCRNRSRCHSDKLYRTYSNVRKEYSMMYFWNETNSLHRLKSMTRYLNNLNQVWKTMRASSSSLIQSRLNAEMIFSLIKILAQLKWFSVSEIKDKEYWFLTVIVFRSR